MTDIAQENSDELGDSAQHGGVTAGEEPPLSPYDVMVISEWRRRGFVVPAPELSSEALNDLVDGLAKVYQRWDDVSAGERHAVRE